MYAVCEQSASQTKGDEGFGPAHSTMKGFEPEPTDLSIAAHHGRQNVRQGARAKLRALRWHIHIPFWLDVGS